MPPARSRRNCKSQQPLLFVVILNRDGPSDIYLSIPPLQPRGAPDHPVRQVHPWGGELSSSLSRPYCHSVFRCSGFVKHVFDISRWPTCGLLSPLMWPEMWTTRTSATSSHTEKRRRSKPPPPHHHHHRLTPLLSDHVASLHTSALPARCVRLPAHYEKTCLLYWDTQWEDWRLCALFVCEHQQGDMGLFSIKK